MILKFYSWIMTKNPCVFCACLVKILTSEDFSFFAKEVSGLFFFIGGCAKGNDVNLAAPHHTAEFIIDDSSLKPGMTVFCNLVFDYLELHKKK